MSREYKHIQGYEKEILTLVEQIRYNIFRKLKRAKKIDMLGKLW